MDKTKQKILSLFKEKSELSTSEIAERIYEEYIVLKEKLEKNKKDIKTKREIARLHRKLLHHINKLIDYELLITSKHGEKGHKFFSLNLSDGEEISEISLKFKKRTIISKPALPIMPIEGYEQQGIVMKYEFPTWIDRLNSIVLLGEKIENIKELDSIIDKIFPLINDCFCIDNFNEIIGKAKEDEIFEFFKKIDSECENFGKKASFIISFYKLKDFDKVLGKIIESNLKNIIFIYDLDSEELQENFGLISRIIFIYLKYNKIIYIKNKKIQKAPCFIGKAGPYSFSDKEWLEKKEILAIACSQSSLIVDTEKFYSLYELDSEKFSQLMLNISKAFLSANSLQRRKSEDYFREILSLNHPNEKEFLELSRNYIRFWNFGLSQPDTNPEIVLNMISEAKKKINEFSLAEETIYKSCGMPTRFKISFSCSFKEASDKLSFAKYKHLEIKNLEDFYDKKIKKEILARESISSMFDGGNDITFHRTGNFNCDDIVREISIIMGNYKLPFFSYSFGSLKGDMKITSFLK